MLVLLDGPTGCGKDTILDELIKQWKKDQHIIITGNPILGSNIWTRRGNNKWMQKNKDIYWFFKGEVLGRLTTYSRLYPALENLLGNKKIFYTITRHLASEYVYGNYFRGYQLDWLDDFYKILDEGKIDCIFISVLPEYSEIERRNIKRDGKISPYLKDTYSKFEEFHKIYNRKKIRVSSTEDYQKILEKMNYEKIN